ncbi:MAG: N4-gp56 family major capsid protein [Clostridiales bacterium]|nr:N4-gp56 family major capsid protein [Clostridiales bacterium]
MKTMLYEEQTGSLMLLDLTLFTANTTADTTGTTGNDLSAEMKTYYHDQLIDNAEPNLVHDQFGSKYPIPAGHGKTIEFRKYSPLAKALTAITEGVKPTGKKLNVSTVLATIQQYGDYVELTDLLEVTAIDRNIDEATILLGSQSGRTLDTITREVLNGGTNVMYAPSVASNGTETAVLLRSSITTLCLLTPKVIRAAITALKRFNTSPFGDGFFAGIVHPDVSSDIMGSTEWSEWNKYVNPDQMYAGEVGKIYKARIAETTEAKIIGPGWIFGDADSDGVCRMTLYTELDGTGSTNIFPAETITTAQAAELTAKIAAV